MEELTFVHQELCWALALAGMHHYPHFSEKYMEAQGLGQHVQGHTQGWGW